MSLGIYLHLPACAHCGRGDEQVFERSPTYNLGPMWRAAGLPFSDESIEGKAIADLLPVLEAGLANLRADPARFRAMNPPNGWGSYEGLCDVVERMIAAGQEHPTAVVRTWR